MPSIVSLFRNAVCGSVAAAVMASPGFRRARRLALSGKVITAIYFHKPNRRLLSRCIGWLKKNGYTFLSVDQLMRLLSSGPPFPKGSVWLSFDDGYRQLLTDTVPVLREHRVPATFFIPAGIVEENGQVPWMHHGPADHKRDCITVAELKQIAALPGLTVAAHTVHHKILPFCSDLEIRTEIGKCKQMLESWTGVPVVSFAYPEGLFDHRETAVLDEFGYVLAATTANAFITAHTDPHFVPRFGIGDNIWFSEAICNMVGVWRPVADPVKRSAHLWNRNAAAVQVSDRVK